MIPSYDNLPPTPIEGEPGLIEVERIYCSDWDSFRSNDRRRLEEAYQISPGYLGSTDEGPAWFGTDEGEAGSPFLGASVEPPGLQVYGMLPPADLSAWDARFRAAADGLPARRIG